MTCESTKNFKPMQFGLMFFSSSEDTNLASKYDLLIESAKFGDQHGFSSIWIPERHFTTLGCLYPNPSVLQAALAMVTQNIRLQAGSVVLPLHNPIRIAEEWAIVDNLSNGRVGISLATGWNPNDFVFFPEKYFNRRDEVILGMNTLRKLWSGETIWQKNGTGQQIQVRTYPTPIQSELPIWLTATNNPDTFRIAGEIGAHLVTHLFNQNITDLAKNIMLYRQARANVGYPLATGEVTVALHTFIGKDIDLVREQIRQPYCEYLKSNLPLLQELAVSSQKAIDVSVLSTAEVNTMAEFIFEKFYNGRSLLGTPETCQETLAELDAIGVTEVACLLDFGVEDKLILDSLPYLQELKSCYEQAQSSKNAVKQLVVIPENTSQLVPSWSQEESIAAIQSRCPQEILPNVFYKDIQKFGVKLNSSLQRIEKLWFGDKEALGWISATINSEQQSYTEKINSTLIDGCIQVFFAALPIEVKNDTNYLYFPIKIQSICINEVLNHHCFWSHAVLKSDYQSNINLFEGDIYIHDADGRIIGHLLGLQIQRQAVKKQQLEFVNNWFYKIHWEPFSFKSLSRSAHVDKTPKTWLIMADAQGVGEALAAKLNLAHQSCVLVFSGSQFAKLGDNRFVVDPMHLEHLHSVMEEVLETAFSPLQGIVYLWALPINPNQEDIDTSYLKNQLTQMSHGVIHLLQTLTTVESNLTPLIWLVTQGVHAIDSPLSAQALSQSCLWGLGRTLCVEYPQFWGGLIDLDRQVAADVSATQLHQILINHPIGEDQIALRQGQSFVARLVHQTIDTSNTAPLTWQPNASYLITGGLGDLGLLAAQWMAKQGAKHIVLLGRSPLPPKTEWDTVADNTRQAHQIKIIRELESFGTTVWTVTADITNSSEVKTALEELSMQGCPNIRGLLHIAGVPQPLTSLTQLDSNILNAVLYPKALGAWTLNSLFADKPLEFFILYSSWSSLLGNISQNLGAYSAANAVLDCFAHYRHSKGQPVLCINWGDWAEIGMRARYAQQESLLPHQWTISPTQGMQILELLMQQKIPQLAVAPVNWEEWQQIFPFSVSQSPFLKALLNNQTQEKLAEEHISNSSLNITQLLQLSREEQLAHITSYFQQQAAKVLRLPSTQLDIQQPLNSLGLDSLMAVELKHKVERDTRLTVSLVHFIRGGSVQEISLHILEQLRETPNLSTNLAIVPTDLKEHPLSYNQSSLWLEYLLNPQSAAYNIIYAAKINCDIDVSLLQQVLQTLIRRHLILQTCYKNQQNQPVQYIVENPTLSFEIINVINWSQTQLLEYIEIEADRPFVLEQDLPLRVKLFKHSDREYSILLVVHHIAVDFWSLDILLQELQQLYSAQITHCHNSLPDLDVQYIDYVYEQIKLTEIYQSESLWNYWQQKLAGELPILELPINYPRSSIKANRGRVYKFPISTDVYQQLKELSKHEGATLYNIILTAFYVLLYRYTGQNDLIIGSPTSGRNSVKFESVVGDFVNPVPLRVNLSGNPTFLQLLQQVKTTVLQALEHQDYPFQQLVARLQPTRDLSRTPIFQTAFIWNKPQKTFYQEVNPKIEFEQFASAQRGSALDLTLTIFESKAGLSAAFQYDTDLYETQTIINLVRHFQNLLASALSNPQQKLSQLSLLSLTDQQQQIITWNSTHEHEVLNKCLHEQFEAIVEQYPDAIALVFENQSLTYQELNQRSNQLAYYLRRLGVTVDTLVGVCTERSPEMIIAILGILKAGGAYVPLDPTYPKQRLGWIVEDAKINILITQKQWQESLSLPSKLEILIDQDWHKIASESTHNPTQITDLQNLAYVIYTSGSTGKPKGVLIEHQGVCNIIHSSIQRFDIKPNSRILQAASLNFDASVLEIFSALHAGGTLFLINQEFISIREHTTQQIAQHQINTIIATPSFLQILDSDDCHSVDTLILGGEACSMEQAQKWSFCKKLFNTYGNTEVSIYATVAEYRNSVMEKPAVGFPIANVQSYILDQDLNIVPVGAIGELYIGGIGIARGYLNRPDLTSERFIPNPFNTQSNSRLYKTGDLAYSHKDGNIHFVGRIDHQVKIRGFRIELGEIESVLLQHDSVKNVAVIVQEDPSGDKRLIAYIVANPNSIPTTRSLRSFLKQMLPQYMIPNAFVTIDELPLAASGKVNRQALSTVDYLSNAQNEQFKAPQTEVEKTVSSIWAEVLKLETISVEDDFFELGGHSILVTQVVSRLREIYQVEIPIRSLFENPTIANVAEQIETTLLLQQLAQNSSYGNNVTDEQGFL